jgi:hypothetical protein
MRLHIDDFLAAFGLVPAPIELFGRPPQLHNKVTRQVLGLGLTALLPPELQQGSLVGPHDNPSIGAADK